MSTGVHRLSTIATPRSSTQCELVALSLVSAFQPSPSLILSDSLCSLQLIRSWGLRSTAASLSSVDRLEVRSFLYQWQDHPHPPMLEKVKAHDEVGRRGGNAKTFGISSASAPAHSSAAPGSTSGSSSSSSSAALPLLRQLTVADLRRAERRPPVAPAPPSALPTRGQPARKRQCLSTYG